ncbi:MAG TPA: hypothetical protein VFV34_10435, partial [Blastocatellia bacterium]|nr:hypothetical protein [Blastocatellia bacterium]
MVRSSALAILLLSSLTFSDGMTALRPVDAVTRRTLSDRASSFGPPGGWVISLAIDPKDTRVVYAGLHGGGIIKSTDGGETWFGANQGLQDLTVMPIVIDPKNTKTLYVGTHVGIYKSTDGAKTWSSSFGGLTNADVWGLTIDPKRPETLYAGTTGGG